MRAMVILTEGNGDRSIFEYPHDAWQFMRNKMWRDHSISNEFITMSGSALTKLVIFNGKVPIATVEALPFKHAESQ